MHQLRFGTDETVGELSHKTKEAILEDPVGTVHPIRKLGGETEDAGEVSCDGGDFGNDDVLIRMLCMHVLKVADGSVPVRAVVMQSEVVRSLAGGAFHEIGNPRLAGGVVRARRADEPLPFVLAKRDHLSEPEVGRVLGGDVGAFGLVEVMDDRLVRLLDVVPVAARKLGFQVYHGPVRIAAFELGRYPRVPVAYGRDGPVEVDSIHRHGTPACPAPSELVQSQRRQRLRTTMMAKCMDEV